MSDYKAIAVVGMGAILPDAPNVAAFWKNICDGLYSIREVPADRWKAELYYDPDPAAPDKTYSKIGAWVRDFHFEPQKMGIAIPPRVVEVMDPAQQWGIATAYQALQDYGYPEKPLNLSRTAVILGNAMAGENHYRSTLRVHMAEVLDTLSGLSAFQGLSQPLQAELLKGLHTGMTASLPRITEDTMPGELGNIIAGRIANVFNLAGPNFVTDAACASSFAALNFAMDGLISHAFDAVLTGGVDRNMGVESFVKFSKIGALSPDGSRPYAEGANGFVMGEGAAIFLLKRLEDAERDGDRVYAVVRGVAGSSDGKGKGITAPNPVGQQRAIERAWKSAGLSPASASLMEGHGTSTRVGDVVEVNALSSILAELDVTPGSVALGSVKSNIGHLKSAAGAAGMLKAVLALYHDQLPPSVNCDVPNSQLDFSHLPLRVNTDLRPWEVRRGNVRRAGLSSFGFGGTNFHVVLEEYLPGMLSVGKSSYPGVEIPAVKSVQGEKPVRIPELERGLLFLSAESTEELRTSLTQVLEDARSGRLPDRKMPSTQQIAQPQRLAIDFADAPDLLKRGERALNALASQNSGAWPALAAQGVYRGAGVPGKVAFLFPGQGSQYTNMMRDLCAAEPVVAETFAEADRVMEPILGRSLTSYIYVSGDEAALAQAEADLRNTEITQPAMLTADVAMLRLMAKYGYFPDTVIGHSLGEYAALVAAGSLKFTEALEIVSARGREMSKVSMADNGCMAAVSAPLPEVERILKTVDGYAVIANINSPLQAVIGGATPAVDAAITAFQAAGFQAVKIPVSHAFHTKIVAPASAPMREVIARMAVLPPQIPVAANVTGEFYPSSRDEILDMLALQLASPVQFVRGIQRLYNDGARVFVEIGPKRVLNSLAADNLKDKADVTILATNHPRKGAVVSFNEALCGLLAAGVAPFRPVEPAAPVVDLRSNGKLVVNNEPAAPQGTERPGVPPIHGSVVISGAALGLPGQSGHVFQEDNIMRLLNGELRIEPLSDEKKMAILEKRVTRLVKSDAGAVMEEIDHLDQIIKLAAQRGAFNPTEEFGIPVERIDASDISTQLAIAAGIDALRDAGIPLVMNYKKTSTGSLLPNRWMLPEALKDETGVIFASAFPGLERMAEEADRFYTHQSKTKELESLKSLLELARQEDSGMQDVLAQRIGALESELSILNYTFDRRFIFRVLPMGHSQFAEYVGARGPNTSVNAACASTTLAVSLADDWIRAGRCRRVIIIAGDDVTDGHLAPWIGSGLFASGTTTVEGNLRLAALPFDRRRNGMIPGMGAAALVVESQDAVAERGMRAICEVVSTQAANSAFHGTRLDVQHVAEVMERVVATAEERFGINRHELAEKTMFVSHETYTPARGGSAAAEIHALRQTFQQDANRVLIANTKGFTGHTMGVGIEDVMAVKALQYGIVPPIANLDEDFQPDPDLGDLNLSRGGKSPVRYALRLGAGFGSQVAMSLLRKIPGQGERIDQPVYQRWLAEVSGMLQPELETIQHTLRVRHTGAPQQIPARSQWQYGQAPRLWAAHEADAAESTETQPEAHPLTGEASGEVLQPAPQTANHEEDIRAFVLAAVSEKTGYPAEMLELDLDLEADLGIDTVKQAELFAAVREHFDIPRREDLRLSDYNTLAKVIGFVEDSRPTTPDAAEQPIPEAAAEPVHAQHAAASYEDIRAFVLAAVSEKTGYPAEMLELDLDLEADLGIDTVKQAELFAAVREHFDIPRREDLRLSDYNTLAKVIGFVEDSRPTTPDAAEQPIPEAAAEPVHAQHAAASHEDIRAFVLAAVSEKTGYPAEMLELDLDLEADLGIDTVKQAELFAAVREHFDIPRREDLRLSDYNTLAKVIGFVEDSRVPAVEEKNGFEPPVTEVEELRAEESSLPGPEAPESAEVVIRRRLPIAVLRPQLNLCYPSGVSLAAGTRVVIVNDAGKVGAALARKLRARKVEVLTLNAPLTSSDEEKLQTWLAEGALQGVYYLPALDEEKTFPELTGEDWSAGQERNSYTLYRLMRALPGEPFVVGATRLGGLCGLGKGSGQSVFGGATAGFLKALKRERPDALVKWVDFEQDAAASEIAGRLVDETLQDPSLVEIGWEKGLRFTISLEDRAVVPVESARPQGEVFVVSGGSSGVVGSVVTDLAQAAQGKFYLLSRTPLPDVQDSRIRLWRSDRAALKRELASQISAAGGRATPAAVERKLAEVERAASVLDTIAAVERTGSKAVYLTCDITDPQAVDAAIARVLEAEGKVDVLIHGAGLERSRRLENKPEDEFRQVMAVKADGFFNLFKALERRERLPESIVLFSSVSGRFGNAGQTDYSAANDLLVKTAAALNAQYPALSTVVIDWGAWAEVGMASRGYMPELMRKAGMDLMAPAAAAPLVRRELLAGTRGEVILAANMGGLDSPSSIEGLDVELANQALSAGKPAHTMLTRVTGITRDEGVLLETDLDPQQEPFLRDHALNGIPLLPGVMGIEGFTVAARHISTVLAGGSSLRFETSVLEDIQFLAPLKFYRNEPRHTLWKAQVRREESGLVAQVSLESDIARRNGQTHHLLHFAGRVYLGPVGTVPSRHVQPPHWNGAYTVQAADIYRLYFHGPAFQVLEGVQCGNGLVLGRLRKNQPDITALATHLMSAPMLVELCMQTAGVWEAGLTGTLALPQSIGELTIYPAQVNGIPVFAEVQPQTDVDGKLYFNARVVDERGEVYLEMRNYHTAPLPYTVEAQLIAPMKELTERGINQ